MVSVVVREKARRMIESAIAKEILDSKNPPITFLKMFGDAESLRGRQPVGRLNDVLAGRRAPRTKALPIEENAQRR